MPQIYDMGPTALLPLQRKACWGFFYSNTYMFKKKLKLKNTENDALPFAQLHTTNYVRTKTAVSPVNLFTVIQARRKKKHSSTWNHVTKCTWEIKPGTVDPTDWSIRFLQDDGTQNAQHHPPRAPYFKTAIIKMLAFIFYKQAKLQFFWPIKNVQTVAC